MILRAGRLLSIALAAAGISSGQTILWNSEANAVNQTSDGQAMDAGFRFELGVFTGTFIPTPANTADWSANWNALQRTPYATANHRFSNSTTPANNDGAFEAAKPAYIWGFRGTPASGEWILFRAIGWTFPDANPPVPPPPLEWFAQNATAVLGSINPSGIPFLMKSAAVTNAAPPRTTWEQWRTDHLSGEPLNAPADDPDLDGTSNLMEFIFGTAPKTPGPPVTTPITLVSGFLQISIPRRIDHVANLTVEVSSDLALWQSGPAHTTLIADNSSSLIVRDLTPLDTAHPKRFVRLKASLPSP